MLLALLSISVFFGTKIVPKEESGFSTIEEPAPEPTELQPWTLARVLSKPVDHFDAALQRPLFVQSRRPPATATSAPPQLDARLVGILSNDAGRIAMILAGETEQVSQLREGEAFQGWRVVKISERFVDLQRENRSKRLELTFVTHPEPETAATRKEQEQVPRQNSRVTGTFFVTDECGLTQCQGAGRQDR